VKKNICGRKFKHDFEVKAVLTGWLIKEDMYFSKQGIEKLQLW
jgi:hypothetical protein